VSPERFKEIQDRYERMKALANEPGPAVSHACALSYSLDVPDLIAEVKRLQGVVEFERARNRGLVR
jgi:hypothetical protein